MTSKLVKTKIYQVLDEIPEPLLEEVLNYLNCVKDRTKDELALSRNLSKILEEDRKLLEKLAQ